jgi:hypothetical protein
VNQIERRTFGEILARYDLEPSLRDVFVEGCFDREVLSRCFQNRGQVERIVYEIDSVEIPVAHLLEEGLTNGNKQRLIALARLLASNEQEVECRCLVDKDLDHWFEPFETNRNLVWTDHCSIELYFFTDELLKDLLLVAAKAQIHNWQLFLDSMTKVLLDLYSMRLADHELAWSMAWLPVHKHLSVNGDSIVLDSDEYIFRLLLKNGRSKSEAEFSSSLNRWSSVIAGDPRKAIRGHDLIEILCWSIRAFRGLKELTSIVAVERIFLLGAPKISGLVELFSTVTD